MPLLSIEDVQAQLPKVGDVRIETTIVHRYWNYEVASVQECVVDYVNLEHLWYRVRFKNGTLESYKLPKLNIGAQGALLDPP